MGKSETSTGANPFFVDVEMVIRLSLRYASFIAIDTFGATQIRLRVKKIDLVLLLGNRYLMKNRFPLLRTKILHDGSAFSNTVIVRSVSIIFFMPPSWSLKSGV